MHTEHGPDPRSLTWVTVGDRIQGEGVAVRQDSGWIPDILPKPVADCLSPVAELVTIRPGRITITVRSAAVARVGRNRGAAGTARLLRCRRRINAQPLHPLAPGAAGTDSAIATAVERVLQGDLAELATSHGGELRLRDVRDGVVRIELRGACHGCPAAGTTLRQGVEQQLRARVPGVRRVEAS